MAQQQFVIQKAVKSQKKARIALDGPAGSGKTYTALELAIGLADGGRIGLIDTEKSSADLYADRFDFDTIKLSVFSPQNYIGALEAFGEAGYDVVIIDSWSHAWEGEGGALEMVDAAARKYSGNSYVAWRDVTPLHNRMVAAILDYPGHVIVTMRTKMEYALEKSDDGKTAPKKIGMAPIQRAGVEYEFDVVVDLDLEHHFTVSKTRLPILDGKSIKYADRKVGKAIREDLMNGAAPPPKPQIEKATPQANTFDESSDNNGSAQRIDDPADAFPHPETVVDTKSLMFAMNALGLGTEAKMAKAMKNAGMEGIAVGDMGVAEMRKLYETSRDAVIAYHAEKAAAAAAG